MNPRADRPDKFEQLAVYNAECARGIVHTPDWDARMAALQKEWDRREMAGEALYGLSRI